MQALENIKNLDEVANYITEQYRKRLHEGAYLDVLNVLIDFINDSEVLYEQKRENEETTHTHIARVCNAIMGSGKSTALQVIAQMVIESGEIPLLCVFNNKSTMKDFERAIKAKMGNLEGKLLVIHSDNFDSNIAELVQDHQVVAITQQRLRDMTLGYGDGSNFKSYIPKTGWIEPLQRSIIIDEMPIFIDSEMFDIGKLNNCLDWFDEMVKYCDLERIDVERSRAIIPFIISMEMAETCNVDNGGVSISAKKLMRHVPEERTQQFLEVLKKIKSASVEYKLKNRYHWFMKLLHHDEVGVVSREENKSMIFCSGWIDYRKLGNVLILDGTASITQNIYSRGGYELVNIGNHHNYEKRLKIHFREINTSKESRKKDSIQQIITNDIKEIRDLLRKQHSDILPLSPKENIQSYLKSGAITQKQWEEHFASGVIESDESMAINLLNTTGKNDLAKYSSLALLSLPLRHPSYYKLFAIAMLGTGIDVSLQSSKEFSKSDYCSIKWFNNENVQEIYRELVLTDFSQIIHRTSLRYLNQTDEVDIYIYSNRVDWLNELKTLYSLPSNNIDVKAIQKKEVFEKKCREYLVHAVNFMKTKGLIDCTAGKISRSFKEWLNREWKKENHRGIIEKIAQELNLEIEENIVTAYKTLILLR